MLTILLKSRSSYRYKVTQIVNKFMMPPKSKKQDNKQKNIASFFTKPGKRSSDNKNNDDTPSSKKTKTNLDTSPPLSPDQRKRIEENKKEALKKLEHNAQQGIDMGHSWKVALQSEFTKPYFQKLQDFLIAERKRATIYPPEKHVYSWTRFCDIQDLKVVILGQDPYHGPNQAHGLCFSVQIGVPAPPSLVNMYKELASDISGFKKPDHGHLVGWAKQGVLLLNACLTVEASKPNSHKDKGWEKFTDATVKYINDNLNNVVFILWGGYAQKKGKFLNKSRHLVLTGVHPSPLSAHRGFFGCKHFSKANEYLKKNRNKEIDWSYLPASL
ncbi:uracil-DNA glycosylase-like [Hydractinia symbiolongicarpus]|uniref:uracil-DNA glycosylase-like n=1 Tax=Hydractinia symbiolongicarpus TaxID=13093 RepID=UPI002549E194|nr:uracil-DNA glycosylase-like [Hydractinia symbiolongicarpus]